MSRVEGSRTTFLISVLCWAPCGYTLPLGGQQRRSPVAPSRERVEAVVREAYDKYRSETNGKNTDYIPIWLR